MHAGTCEATMEESFFRRSSNSIALENELLLKRNNGSLRIYQLHDSPEIMISSRVFFQLANKGGENEISFASSSSSCLFLLHGAAAAVWFKCHLFCIGQIRTAR